ncbi:MAG TPA: quinohemoprotein amine dehydrogenase subunit alpha [Bryobacteraceae bacterium]
MRKACGLRILYVLLPAGLPAALAQSNPARGIPVTDPLVISKCGQCHPADSQRIMPYVSWERTTPEGWQDVLKRMILGKGLTISPEEARSIVRYLSDAHGLAPEEAKPVLYEAERRMHEETDVLNEDLHKACEKCHSLARALSWRRSAEDWEELAKLHTTRYKAPANPATDEAIAYLSKTAPLDTPEWAAWSARDRTPNLTGRWLVVATIRGRGKYFGEMEIAPGSSSGEFATRVTLESVKDGSTLRRAGLSVVYGGYAWRGRSKGSEIAATLQERSAPDNLAAEMRETLWIAPDQSRAEGRWFWGQYQEFGFDVELQRPAADGTLLALDRWSLKTGTRDNRIRLVGDRLPIGVAPADLSLGAGVTVGRIVSSSPQAVVAEVDVGANAAPGKRDVSLRGRVLRNALAIYDRVDYVKVMPESAVAAFGDGQRARGYQQFEAIAYQRGAYQRGADGKPHTADDIELGPIDAASWSLQVFNEKEGGNFDYVGKVSDTGFFTPNPIDPKNNFDVWVIATTKETDSGGKALVGKAYLVVTVPSYTFNGRRYVRDVGRWVDDGPAQ